MKKFLLNVLLLFSIYQLPAQLTFPADGDNKQAVVGETIGLTDILIEYSRPAVKGREGKIWGQLVYAGYQNLGIDTTKRSPWRAGANESTTISFSTDVMVQGKKLAAGKYGFFIAYDSTECTLIFSRNNTAWGSFYYDPKEDALRVTAKPMRQDRSTERLKFEFSNETETSTVVSLIWEKLAIPFQIDVDLIQIQLASIRRELQTDKGFTWQSWRSAAQWCVDKNANLEEALQWIDKAISFSVGRNFTTLATKSAVLEKLDRKEESAKTLKEAIELGSSSEVYSYGRQLLTKNKLAEAMDVFQKNFSKFPDQFISLLGLARGYSAMGNYTKALEHLEKALPLAPNTPNRNNAQRMIGLLKQGKDIN